jgi:hypothetical protein
MRSRLTILALLLVLCTPVATAQDKPQVETPPEPVAAQPREAGPAVPLKVTVVIARYRGDKRISSLPYVLGVVANGPRTTLRMGSDVPVPQVVVGGDASQQRSYSYRSVGTNIDCTAFTASSGTFRLVVTVTDSSVHVEGGDTSTVTPTMRDVPMFRTFNSSFSILLRDGQTTEYTSATDPVTGEVMKIDVTLNVLK